jgi:hypothetical protein
MVLTIKEQNDLALLDAPFYYTVNGIVNGKSFKIPGAGSPYTYQSFTTMQCFLSRYSIGTMEGS